MRLLNVKIIGTLHLLLILLSCAPAAAQPQVGEPLPPAFRPSDYAQPSDAESSYRPSGAGDVEGMYRSLKTLQDRRRSAVADVGSHNGQGNGQPVRFSGDRQVSNLRRQLKRNTTNASRQSDRIQKKLDRLKLLMRDRALCQPSTDAPNENVTAPLPDPLPPPVDSLPATPSTAKAANASATDTNKGQAAAADDVADHSLLPTASTMTLPVSPGDSPDNTTESTQAVGQEADVRLPPSSLRAVSMVDGPVDGLRFANNLYGSGEYQLALEIYQKVDRTNMTPNQRVWIEYQLANCHRHLGNKKLAERSYRMVVGQDRDGWIGQNARWWLNVADRSTRLNQRATGIAQAINQLSPEEKGNARP